MRVPKKRKKKRHSIKRQVVVDRVTNVVINSQIHDFKLFKELKIRTLPRKKVITDAGYQEIQRLHANSVLPKKRKKNTKLTSDCKEKSC